MASQPQFFQPHARVGLVAAMCLDSAAVQTTRMLKLACTSCGWTCRTTRKHIDAEGLICPRPTCGGDLQVVA